MSSTSYRYRVSRPRRDLFDGRTAYLQAKIPDTGFTPKLCQVLQLMNPSDEWSDTFPWVTVVLGSGALELPSDGTVSGASLGPAVADALERELDDTWPRWSEPLPELARAFTESLVKARTDAPASAEDERADRRPLIEPLAARLVLVAALLTRFFHRAGAERPSAFARSESDVARFDPRDHGWDEVDVAVVQPALTEMNRLVRELSAYRGTLVGTDVPQAVQALLRKVVDGLDPHDEVATRELQIDHLRLVTEVAWHFLVAGTEIYPGWSDLLLSMMLREGGRAMEGRGRLRPRSLDLELLPGIVTDLLEPATKASAASWASRKQDGERDGWDEGLDRPRTVEAEDAHPAVAATSVRHRLYEAVACVLGAQAKALAHEDRKTHFPPPVAYVTSFDLELDMALWRAGHPFSIAVPVHVVSGRKAGTVEADFCWLLADIDPVDDLPFDDQLALLRKPHNWRLLTRETTDVKELRARPTVIHLSGCPLFALPAIEHADADSMLGQLASQGVVVDRKAAVLVHAVTVDEYLALRQSEAELFWISYHPLNRDDRRGRALPTDLTANGEHNQRFWMALGVPISDPAVRHRFASHISARWIHAGSEPDRPVETSRDGTAPAPMRSSGLPVRTAPGSGSAESADPECVADDAPEPTERTIDVSGLAVNLRIDEDDAQLLYWLGLDVVRDDCRTFINDLFHYGLHVLRDETPPPSRSCTLSP